MFSYGEWGTCGVLAMGCPEHPCFCEWILESCLLSWWEVCNRLEFLSLFGHGFFCCFSLEFLWSKVLLLQSWIPFLIWSWLLLLFQSLIPLIKVLAASGLPISSHCWRVLMFYFSSRHYGPLLASALQAGSPLHVKISLACCGQYLYWILTET